MATVPPGQPLTADQQKAYNLIVKQAMEFLLQEDHAKLIVQKAEQGDPKQAVVDAISPLMQNIYASAQAAGAKVDTVTVLAATIEVIANLSEMLAAVGVITKEEIPKFAGEVGRMGVAQHNAKAGAAGAGAGAGLAAPVAAQAGAAAQPPAAPAPAGFLGSV